MHSKTINSNARTCFQEDTYNIDVNSMNANAFYKHKSDLFNLIGTANALYRLIPLNLNDF